MNTINSNSRHLANRVLLKDDFLGTGYANITLSQKNGINPAVVDRKRLQKYMQLTEENRLKLMNDALLYAAINSRNLEHLNVILADISTMKNLLEIKCKPGE